MQLYPIIRLYEHFFVVNAEGDLPKEIEECTLRIVHSERDWKLLLNFWEAYRILSKRRPDVILSCGAGPAVPFAIVGKLLGVKVIFVESFAAVDRPTLTGRLIYPISDLFIYQWKRLATFYPKGIYGGAIF
jgi:UDP-N-acetylglucosamine:LPS N-acetylglucosamine transferase